MIELVRKVLAIKENDNRSDTKELEQEIDNLVYKMFNLTNEEIKQVEASAN